MCHIASATQVRILKRYYLEVSQNASLLFALAYLPSPSLFRLKHWAHCDWKLINIVYLFQYNEHPVETNIIATVVLTVSAVLNEYYRQVMNVVYYLNLDQ